MSKVAISDIVSGYRSYQKFNENLETLASAFDNTLSRDGTSPNQMEANLDMNGYRVINLPTPINPEEPVRLADIDALISGGSTSGATLTATQQAILNSLDNELYNISRFGPVGTSNDTATFLAAALSGKKVFVPPISTNSGYYLVDQIPLYNRSCFYGIPNQTRIRQRVQDRALVKLQDPYASMITFTGFVLDGQWSFVSNSDSAMTTHMGVDMSNAYAGVNDAQYVSNAGGLGYMQIPRHVIRDISIHRFGSYAFKVTGAGGMLWDGIQVQNCGKGPYINGYDSSYSNMDIGAIYQRGLEFGSQASSLRVSNVKVWYTGQGQLTNYTQGIWFDRSSSLLLSNITVQDPAGTGLVLDRCVNVTIEGSCEWQGTIPWMDSNVRGIKTIGCKNLKVDWEVRKGAFTSNTYPNITMIWEDAIHPTDGYYSNGYVNIPHARITAYDNWDSAYFPTRLDNFDFYANEMHHLRYKRPNYDGRILDGFSQNGSLLGRTIWTSLASPADRIDDYHHGGGHNLGYFNSGSSTYTNLLTVGTAGVTITNPSYIANSSNQLDHILTMASAPLGTRIWGSSSGSPGLVQEFYQNALQHIYYSSGTGYVTTQTNTDKDVLFGVPIQIPNYTVATLPTNGAKLGWLAYATNGRKNGEGAGSGTGVLVFRDGGGWKACDTGALVAS